MKFQSFNHQTIKKYVICMGTLLNDIYVDRLDTSNNVGQTIKVPVSYGPKERYIARADQNPELTREVSLVYPRISFEISAVALDPERMLTKTQQLVSTNQYASTLTSSYREVPYNFNFTVSIIARNQNDLFMIVEQILPFYTPDYTLSVELIPELGITKNIPIIINSVIPEDIYGGQFEDAEYCLWTINFTLKGSLYGPVSRAGVITLADANIWVNEDTFTTQESQCETVAVTANTTTITSTTVMTE